MRWLRKILAWLKSFKKTKPVEPIKERKNYHNEAIEYDGTSDTLLLDKISITDRLFIKSGYADPLQPHFKDIKLNDVEVNDYESNGLMIHAIDTKVIAEKIKIKQTDNAIKKADTKAFSVACDATQIYNGNELVLDELTVKNAKNTFFFAQNLKSWDIKGIVSDGALYNEDGSDSFISSSGVTFVKFDNAISDEVDLRSGKIGKIIFKNSNRSLELKLINGKKGSIYRRGVWFDEGFNNCVVGFVDMDLPFVSAGNSEYNPKSSGNHHFKHMILRGRLSGHASMLANDVVDRLELHNHEIHLRGTHIKHLYARGSEVVKFKGTVIDSMDIDSKTKIIER